MPVLYGPPMQLHVSYSMAVSLSMKPSTHLQQQGMEVRQILFSQAYSYSYGISCWRQRPSFGLRHWDRLQVWQLAWQQLGSVPRIIKV